MPLEATTMWQTIAGPSRGPATGPSHIRRWPRSPRRISPPSRKRSAMRGGKPTGGTRTSSAKPQGPRSAARFDLTATPGLPGTLRGRHDANLCSEAPRDGVGSYARDRLSSATHVAWRLRFVVGGHHPLYFTRTRAIFVQSWYAIRAGTRDHGRAYGEGTS